MQKVDDSPQLNPVVCLETSQVDVLATVLSRVFHNEPSFVYVMPDEEIRRTVSPWFFRSAIHASLRYGEIRTTEAADAAALWISPEHDLTFGRMVRTGMIETPFKLGWSTFRNGTKLGSSVDEIRKRLAAGPHWYLMALGVEPTRHDREIGEVLIDPVLSRADSKRMSCYTETFNEKKLGFYMEYGFHIIGAGKIPGGGPQFWAMTRLPRG